MGPPLKIQMGGLVRAQILNNREIFTPILQETQKTVIDSKPVYLSTSDEESRISITSSGDQTTVLLTYAIDNDDDKSNGRLKLEDQFIYDNKTKKLLSVQRAFSASMEKPELWNPLFNKLTERGTLKTDDPDVVKFFKNVILELPQASDLPASPESPMFFGLSTFSVPTPPDNLEAAHLRRLPDLFPILNQALNLPPDYLVALQEGATFLRNGFVANDKGAFQRFYKLADKDNDLDLLSVANALNSLSRGDLEKARNQFTVLKSTRPEFLQVIQWIDDYAQAKESLGLLQTLQVLSLEQEARTFQSQQSVAGRVLSLFSDSDKKGQGSSAVFEKMRQRVLTGEADTVEEVMTQIESYGSQEEKEWIHLFRSSSFASGSVLDLSRGGALKGVLRQSALLAITREKLIPGRYMASARLLLDQLAKQSSHPAFMEAGRDELKLLSGTGKISDAIDLTTGRFAGELADPLTVGSLLVGSAAFRFAEAGALSGLARIGFESPQMASLIASFAGLSVEAPAFELTQRTLGSTFLGGGYWNDFGSGLLRSYLTFGAFRGVGAGTRFGIARMEANGNLIFGKATAPLLSNGASFGALHLMNEFERSVHLRPVEGPWEARLFQDGAFYLQLGLAGHLAESAMAYGLPTRMLRFEWAPPEKVEVPQPQEEPPPPPSPNPVPVNGGNSPPTPFQRLGIEAPLPRDANGMIMLPDISAMNLSVGQVARQVQAQKGNIFSISHEGIGKRGNEDRFVAEEMPDTRSVLVAIDGMGGHAGGEEAAEIARQLIESAVLSAETLEDAYDLAHRGIQEYSRRNGFVDDDGALMRGAPGAVVMGLEITPRGFGEHDARFVNIGDSEGLVLRFSADASSPPQIVFWTARPIELSQQIRQVRNFSQVGTTPDGRVALDQMFIYRTDANANTVSEALGFKLQMTESFPDQPLKDGDVVLLGSDGFFENFATLEEIARIVQETGSRSPEVIRDALIRENLMRMSLLQQRKKARADYITLTAEVYKKAYEEVYGTPPPDGWKGRYEGWVLDSDGNVGYVSDIETVTVQGDPVQRLKRHPGSGAPFAADHFKTDNTTLIVKVLGDPNVSDNARPTVQVFNPLGAVNPGDALRSVPPPAPKPVVTAPRPSSILSIDDNLPDQPRRGEHHLRIHGYGAVSAFTHEGLDKKVLLGQQSQAINEDAYGFSFDAKGRLVLMVADGMGGYQGGDFASAKAVDSTLQVLAANDSGLGDALWSSHEVIRKEALQTGRVIKRTERSPDGQTTEREVSRGQAVVSMARVHNDGSVEVGMVGDARLWVLRYQADGTYDVVEPFFPDSMVGKMRTEGSLTTLQMHAHPNSSDVNGALGMPKEPWVVDEFTYDQFSKDYPDNFAILDSPLSVMKGGKRELLKLKSNDCLLLMSDGVAGLFDPSELGALLRNQDSADGIRKTIQEEAFRRLEYYKISHQIYQKGYRAPLPNGLFIDALGNVYRTADMQKDTKMVAHYGPDNLTALVYRFDPTVSLPPSSPPSP